MMIERADPACHFPEALTSAEADRLDELERVVDRGLQTFVEVGTALGEIRDRRLYRATHATFEDYCRERWGMGRSHAYRMIDAAEVVRAVSPNGDIGSPSSESVARELVPVMRDDPERVPEVWAEAVEHNGPRPTAGQVREARRRAELPRSSAQVANHIVVLLDEATWRLPTAWRRLSEGERDEIRNAIEALVKAIGDVHAA